MNRSQKKSPQPINYTNRVLRIGYLLLLLLCVVGCRANDCGCPP